MVLGWGSIVLNFWHGFRSRIYMYSWLDGVKETNIYMNFFFFNQEPFIIVCNHNKKLLSVKKVSMYVNFVPDPLHPHQGSCAGNWVLKNNFSTIGMFLDTISLWYCTCTHVVTGLRTELSVIKLWLGWLWKLCFWFRHLLFYIAFLHLGVYKWLLVKSMLLGGRGGVTLH